MPAYDEEEAIEKAVEDVQVHVLDRVPASELVVVNDGSNDRTGQLLDDLALTDSRLRPVHQRNAGHGGALLRGLAEARGRAILLIDSDRQIPLDEFAPFWEELEDGADAVFGVRTVRHDPRVRLVLTRLIGHVLRLVFGTRIRDANVPFKLLRREVWTAARPHIPPDTLAPSLFLGVFARLRGFDLREREVRHLPRRTGEVSIKRWKLARFCAVAFRQLLSFRRSLRRAG